MIKIIRNISTRSILSKHIYSPGGCLLSNQELTTQFTEQTDMVVKQLHDYGFDYAYTLRDWRAASMAQRTEIQALGYDDAFIRLWEFYFCYCEGGFLERTIGVVQVTAVKPNNIDTLHFSDLPSAVLNHETILNDETASLQRCRYVSHSIGISMMT